MAASFPGRMTGCVFFGVVLMFVVGILVGSCPVLAMKCECKSEALVREFPLPSSGAFPSAGSNASKSIESGLAFENICWVPAGDSQRNIQGAVLWGSSSTQCLRDLQTPEESLLLSLLWWVLRITCSVGVVTVTKSLKSCYDNGIRRRSAQELKIAFDDFMERFTAVAPKPVIWLLLIPYILRERLSLFREGLRERILSNGFKQAFDEFMERVTADAPSPVIWVLLFPYILLDRLSLWKDILLQRTDFLRARGVNWVGGVIHLTRGVASVAVSFLYTGLEYLKDLKARVYRSVALFIRRALSLILRPVYAIISLPYTVLEYLKDLKARVYRSVALFIRRALSLILRPVYAIISLPYTVFVYLKNLKKRLVDAVQVKNLKGSFYDLLVELFLVVFPLVFRLLLCQYVVYEGLNSFKVWVEELTFETFLRDLDAFLRRTLFLPIVLATPLVLFPFVLLKRVWRACWRRRREYAVLMLSERARSVRVIGERERMRTSHGSLYLMRDKPNPFEIFGDTDVLSLQQRPGGMWRGFISLQMEYEGDNREAHELQRS